MMLKMMIMIMVRLKIECQFVVGDLQMNGNVSKRKAKKVGAKENQLTGAWDQQ